jgi:hypothetical protein
VPLAASIASVIGRETIHAWRVTAHPLGRIVFIQRTATGALVDGVNSGPEDTVAPYGLAWDTRVVTNGAHTLSARVRDISGDTTLSAAVTVNVANVNQFQNEILATGFDLPTNIEFLPDGRMLVVELQGRIEILPPPYTQPDPTPFLQLTNVGSAGVQQGVYDIVLDPGFASNHFYYAFYTLDPRTGTGCRGSRPTRPTPARSPAARSSSTRTLRTPAPSTTAAP